jgi:hypothetical protein
MSSQDSEGESYVADYIANPKSYGDVEHYGWTTDEEEEDILLPYYKNLTPAEIEAFRMFEVTRVQNKYLTRVNILLEKHIVDLQGINRRLQALVEAALSTPPSTSSSPKKET